MSIVILQLPRVKRKRESRPKNCKYCQGEILQRWGSVKKRVKDTKIRQVRIYRYYCNDCQRSFRHYPEGIQRASQSERLKKLAVVSWSLGLSHRGVEAVFAAFGVSLSRMSSWRDTQEQAEEINQSNEWKGTRVAGIDGAWVNGTGIMVAVDLGDGKLLSVAQVDEKDLPGVMRWLRALKQRHGIGAIVTDDLGMYRGITEQLELGHQVCQFHVRRWVGRAIRELESKLSEEWLWMIDKIKSIMEELPPDGGKQLLEMYKQLPGKRGRERTAVDQLRHVLIRLSESWERYTAFFHDPGIPWTNNRAEQAIGRMKMRAKTTRGYKTRSGRLNGLLVSSTSLS